MYFPSSLKLSDISPRQSKRREQSTASEYRCGVASELQALAATDFDADRWSREGLFNFEFAIRKYEATMRHTL